MGFFKSLAKGLGEISIEVIMSPKHIVEGMLGTVDEKDNLEKGCLCCGKSTCYCTDCRRDKPHRKC